MLLILVDFITKKKWFLYLGAKGLKNIFIWLQNKSSKTLSYSFLDKVLSLEDLDKDVIKQMLQATVKVSLENKGLPNPNPNPIHKPNFNKLEFNKNIRIKNKN